MTDKHIGSTLDSALGELNEDTENGAKIGFEEKKKGWLVPGFQADLILLEKDPFEFPSEIKDIEVGLTLYQGKIVHQKQES